ncbi:hypothetical protein INT46_000499 [Mucor plumbeus]|uniref:Tc1-like transposase DDE domain-containing protein n=1 Tax=Mucor plumbeus TaxID=97098 RepID=A0A8H7R2S3_9FUNG|nr:hypothetical protein INT46_000499 [Mucor plumbeus]
MTRTLPYDVQDSIKSLLLRNTLLCSITKMYPTVGIANLSKYRREFLEGAQASTSGRSNKYIARMVRNDSLDGLRGAQGYLRSTNISMSLSGAEKLLNEWGLKPKEKTRPILSVQPTKNSIFDWRKWVFSDRTRVNIGGSDSESFYWSDVPGTNRPHKVRSQVQGSVDGVMLWGCISGDGPGYSTAIIDGTIDSNEYVEILKTLLMQALDGATSHKSNITKAWFSQNKFFVGKILDWPPQSPDLNPIEHIRGDLKRHLDAYPNRPATNMPRRIEAVIKSRGGATTKYQ